MQTATDSLATKPMTHSLESMPASIEYIEDGVFKSMVLDIATHEHRVKLSKHVVWAANRKIELRIRFI